MPDLEALAKQYEKAKGPERNKLAQQIADARQAWRAKEEKAGRRVGFVTTEGD